MNASMLDDNLNNTLFVINVKNSNNNIIIILIYSIKLNMKTPNEGQIS